MGAIFHPALTLLNIGCIVVTYFIAGLVARFVLSGDEFYPPSPTAISYLRDPAGPGMALTIWPAQVLRDLLFALVLFPLRKRFMELGVWGGGFVFGGIIFVVGFVAAFGGMIEHFVWFTEYPIKFALIMFIEILVQVAIMGPWIVKWMNQAALDQEFSTSSVPHVAQVAHSPK